MTKHQIEFHFGGQAEMGWRQPHCSCGWVGNRHYAYEGYPVVGSKGEADRHLRLTDERTIDQILLKALTELRAVGPSRPIYGICGNWPRPEDGCDEKAASARLRDLMEMWPEYSGDRMYPVKGVDGMKPEAAFQRIRMLWDWETKYGAARWRLLDWLIEHLECLTAI